MYKKKWALTNVSVLIELGDSATGIHKQSLYEHNGVAVCSQRRALIIASTVFAILFAIAIIIAYAGPQNCKSSQDRVNNFRVIKSSPGSIRPVNIFYLSFSIMQSRRISLEYIICIQSFKMSLIRKI